MTSLTRESPAKINLTLRVVGRRPDGYHDIESLIARVTLYDTVTVRPRDDGRWTLRCDHPDVPSDERNLALQAVQGLAAAAGGRRGVEVTIKKRIPPGAGLGGGSSNAATVLLLLNELWELGLTPTELARIGAQVGADVPLFFATPVCLVRGRGDQIEAVRPPLSADLLLLLSGIHCETPAVYRAWDGISEHPQRPGLADVLATLDAPAQLARLLFNDLEEPAYAVVPELAALAAELRRACPGPVRMSGSGSAFFCLDAAGTGDLALAEQQVRANCPRVRTMRVTVES